MHLESPKPKKTLNRQGRALLGTYTSYIETVCAPIFWGDPGTGEITDNGTVSFLNLDGRILGLTAGHVLEGLQTFVTNGGDACRLGKANFFPLPEFLFHPQYPAVDLGLIELSEPFLAVAGKSASTISSWPPSIPSEHEVVVAAGYPAVLRRVRDEEVDWECFMWFGKVYESTTADIKISLDLAHTNPIANEKLPEGFRVGGMSGGPLFMCVDGGTIERIELAGIIYQGIDSFEIMYAHALNKSIEAFSHD